MWSLIFLTGVLVCCAALCLLRLSDHDEEQAALLPFADDPEAARLMTAETGRVCERVVTPRCESHPRADGHFDA
jgi:hypothetical protein